MIQVRPTLSEVLAHEAGAHTHVALTAEVIVDGFTPVALFAALAGDRPGAFLLESVEGGELLGRYSFMGFDVERRVVPEPGDTFGAIHRRLAERRVWSSVPLPRFAGGVVGFVGFDAISELEPVPLSERPGVSIPSAGLLLTDEVLVYDHAGHRLSVIVHAALDGDRAAAYAAARARIEAIIARIGSASSALGAWTEAEIDVDALPVRANVSKADFEGAVERAKQAIVAGEVFQVVLSQRLTVDVSVEPFELYRTLRTTNPSPYMFYLAFDDFALVGASPEVLVRREDE
ncbi:MAG: chorismate-binding protein, partial [Myxococcales bacterium]|nr:chorismate-binding protein [Myxococcales bacterium]